MEEKQWFLYVVDRHEGPFSADEIKGLLKKGEALSTSFVWKDGLADWMMMSDVPEFGVGASKNEGHGHKAFVVEMDHPMGSTPAPAASIPASGPDLGGTTPTSSVWCLHSQKTYSGPFSIKSIVRKINDGEASIQDGVWKEGWTAFVSIDQIPEFMQLVRPDVLSGDSKKKSKKAAGASAALGLAGGPSVRKRPWYRSTAFTLPLTLASLLAVYHFTAIGKLDFVLDKVGVKARVRAMHLSPLQAPNLSSVSLSSLNLRALNFERIRVLLPIETLRPVIDKLPAPVRDFLTGVSLPETLAPLDVTRLRNVAASAEGVRVAAALPVGDELNPSFVVTTNAPGVRKFTATLRGKEGTLLNAVAFQQSFEFQTTEKVGLTPRFSLEQGKPVPRGEYVLTISEGSQPLVNEAFFLGGRRDATYFTRLAEFNNRVQMRIALESTELKQLVLTLESMTFESSTKFVALSTPPVSPQKKKQWLQYHSKYQKISAQMKSILAKATPESLRKDYVLPQLYEKARQTYELTERLHAAETGFMASPGDITRIREQSAQTTQALGQLKAEVFKVIK